ncbi:hypothetical protein ACHAWF_013012 [Thalassiosira exigua]
MARGRNRGYRPSHTCWNCGGAHHGNDCTVRCHRCGGRHYATACRRLQAERRERRQGWGGYTVQQLRDLCRERDLPVSGNRETLKARLDADIAARDAARAAADAAARRASEDAAYAALFDEGDDDDADAAMAEAAARVETTRVSAASAGAASSTLDVAALFDVAGEEDEKVATTSTLAPNVVKPAAEPAATPAAFVAAPCVTQSQSPKDCFDGEPPAAAAGGAKDLSSALEGIADGDGDPPADADAPAAAASGSAPSPAAAAPASRWDGMKLAELKAECKKHGLKVSGKKGDLKARLKERDAASRPPPAPESAPTSAGAFATVPRAAAAATDGARAAWSPSALVPSRTSSPRAAAKEGPKRRSRGRETESSKKKARASSSADGGAKRESPPEVAPALSQAGAAKSGGGEGELKSPPEAAPALSQAGVVKSENEGAGERKSPSVAAPPLSQASTAKSRDEASQVERAGEAELTEAQKERARLNKEMALRRRQELQKRREVEAKLGPVPPGLPPVRQETLDRLSEQQLQVVLAARPPAAPGDRGDAEPLPPHPMVRVNAAAGTGKTTTLLHLAARCIDLGHEALSYVAFSKACAKDAGERIRATLGEGGDREKATATTLHSCAYRLLKDRTGDEPSELEEDARFVDETALKNVIRRNWGDAIRRFNKDAVEHLRSKAKKEDGAKLRLAEKERTLFEISLHYLCKSFDNFCKSDRTLQQQKDAKTKDRHYYPMRKDFVDGDGSASKLGVRLEHYSIPSTYAFYANTAADVWEHLLSEGLLTFDVVIKRAQLMKLRIPCTALLVDESQDLDKCQVKWIADQKKFGTHLFFVGDSAQTIYGFRGAKSRNIMDLDCVDTQLTKSWRFGPGIARVANVPLFAKEKSLLTTGWKRTWIPYRVEGAAGTTKVAGDGEEGENSDGVTTESLASNWQKYKPLTLIGARNAGLMVKAMDLIGLGGLKTDTLSEESGGSTSSEDSSSDLIGTVDMSLIPKIHISGKGMGSGKGKWASALREVRFLYELYSNRDDEEGYLPMTLPQNQFPEFAYEGPVTWDTFHEICTQRGIKKYMAAVKMIATYKQNTLQAMNAIESHVLGQNCSEEEADIILTTCHSAKGLEWDFVEICDDIFDISEASFTDNQKSLLRHPSFLKDMPDLPPSQSSPPLGVSTGEVREGWQFDLDGMNDSDVNLLYVALTRARKKLSVPNSIKMLLNDFDLLHFLVTNMKKDAAEENGSKALSSSDDTMFMKANKRLTKGQVWALYHDLCVPFRRELGVPESEPIVPSLFPECADEFMEEKLERKFTEEKVRKFDTNKRENSQSTVPGDDNVAAFFDI